MSTIGLGMAVYNRDRYLEEAIESVLRQSFSDWELHIVDDCSTDRSLEIAQDYAAWHPRIKVYPQRPNMGCGRTISTALNQCNSQYLAWLDSDDRLEPTALETMVKALKMNPDIGMIYSKYSVIDESGEWVGDGDRCEIHYSPDRLLVDFMTFHFRMIRSTAYHLVGGFDPTLKAATDYDFCLRASEKMKIMHVPRSLYQYRVHSECISVRDRSAQINASKAAVERALERRGMSESRKLEVLTRFRVGPIA
jgi:glycosyltransferase involved in cell wall biosynthesis